MKIKILKILLTLAIIIPALGLIFSGHSRAAGTSVCSGDGAFTVGPIVTAQYADPAHTNKAMPGDTIQVTVGNSCETNNLSYEIFIYPANLDTTKTDLSGYKKIGPIILLPSKSHMTPILIYGTDTKAGAVDYMIRVTGYRIGVGSEQPSTLIGSLDRPLIIATEGIVISGDSSLTKGDTSTAYKFKFYNHSGARFSVYIDSTDTNNRKLKDLSVVSNDFTYNGFKWDTSGTTPGNHQIIVQLDNGDSQTFAVSVTDPNTGDAGTGGTTSGKTFSLSDLNSFNVKNLLACSANDLDGIICMVNKVIAWLLDIGAVISFIMILYASIIYLTSYGDESKAELAKKTLIWSIVGVAVIGVAKGILLLVQHYLP